MAEARPAAAAAPDRGFRGEPVQLGVRWQVVSGHGHGLRGPMLLGSLRWPASARLKTGALEGMLGDVGGLEPEESQRCLPHGLDLDAFLALVQALEKAAQSPVTQVGVRVARVAASGEFVEHLVAFPTFQHTLTHALVEWLVAAANLGQAELTPDRRRAAAKAIHARMDETRGSYRAQMKLTGVNSVRIMRACGETGLPFQLLPAGYLHVGSGRYGRLFRSTFTEATPALATAIARSKSLTASMLSRRGLPVPRHQLVGSAQEAVKAANSLGYPVVVKPDDRDGGKGVHAGLQTDEQVLQFYADAATFSSQVLVETHVEGQDCRITVDNGKVVKAIGRQPGGVLGDGRLTVAELVKAVAAARPGARGSGSLVTIDDEALELLAARGLNARSIPAAGDFVVLRRRANMSTGGTSRDVLGELHPDNARLAVRAAQALRLDVAGIDLIIPDISVSWLECKAAICEVNAQPQISTEFAPHVYRDLLARMVPAPGRMRAVLVLHASAAAHGNAGVIDASRQLAQQGERVLCVRTDGTWLGEERLTPAGRDVMAAAVAAELECEATAVAVALTPAQLLQHGLPWLHVDQVRVVRGEGAVDVARLRASLELLAPHLEGDLLVDARTADELGPGMRERFTVTIDGGAQA